jgi:DMSO reductase anchor subunit
MIKMFTLIAGCGVGAFMFGYVAGAIIKAGHKFISTITQAGD